MSLQYYESVGRRKTSSARVRISSGNGTAIVNNKPIEEYFTRFGDIESALEPAKLSGFEGKLDITITVQGGGVSGQVGAVRHGLARAILEMEPNLRPILRTGGLLTRDARMKERKKPGLKRARKAPTYTKR